MLVRCGAEQEVSKNDAEGEEAVEETERECERKVDIIKFKYGRVEEGKYRWWFLTCMRKTNNCCRKWMTGVMQE